MQSKIDRSARSTHAVPASIQASSGDSRVLAIGDTSILKSRKLAFFCSVNCPGEPIVQAYDFARAMRDARVAVMSGFQSYVEKDCLELLLRGTQPVIVCPARAIQNLRLPTAWKAGIDQKRLLLLSPFAEHIRRPTAALCEQRNEFVANLADLLLFAYADPGGRTEALARKVVRWGKPVFTFDSKENANIVALGAVAIKSGDFVSQLVKAI